MKNTGDLVRLLLFIIAISFMKMVYVPQEVPATQLHPETKQVGRGADTTADKKLSVNQKESPMLSDK